MFHFLGLSERRVDRLVVICLAACLVCPAQETAEDVTPVFRTDTTLIDFTLIALDRQGNPVTDLKPEEIEIKDKGKRREVAFFRYEGGAEGDAFEEASPTAPLPAGTFTNRVELTPGPPRNITAIVIDTLNTPQDKQAWVRSQVVQYLRELTDDTRVAVYLLGEEMVVLHDFTDDTASLRARVEEIDLELQNQSLIDLVEVIAEVELQLRSASKQTLEYMIAMAMSFNAQVRRRRTEKSLASLRSLGDHLAGIPGRKSVVWIGGGISVLSITGALGTGTGGGGIQSYAAWVTDTARQLADQGVTMYVVDAKGLEGRTDASKAAAAVAVFRGPRPSPFQRQELSEEFSSDPLPAMYAMAKITGGRVFWQTNDMATGMKAVESDIRGTYAVGFYAVGDPDERWHSLNVKVKRKGVRIMHPKGYESKPVTQTAEEWTDEEWTPLIYNPLGSSSVRLDVHCELTESGDAKTISLGLGIIADDLHFRENGEAFTAEVDIAIAEKTTAGGTSLYRTQGQAEVAPGKMNDSTPIRYRRSWELTPGTSTIRVIVRDRLTDLYGVIDVPVKEIPVSSGTSDVAATP